MLKKNSVQIFSCRMRYTTTHFTRNLFRFSLLVAACMLFTGCSKKRADPSPKVSSEKTDTTQDDLKPKDSNTAPASGQKSFQQPDKNTVLSIRSAALAGMDSKDVERLKTIICNANLRLEALLIFGDLQDHLTDPNDGYWNYLEQTGEIITGYSYKTEDWEKKDSLGLTDEEFQQQYGEPVYAHNDYDAKAILRLLEELKLSIYNDAFSQDFDILIELVQKAKETHDVNCVINIYRILHDMDYYLLRYGPEDLGKYVQDKSTILKFYGVLEDYKGTEYYNKEGFLS